MHVRRNGVRRDTIQELIPIAEQKTYEINPKLAYMFTCFYLCFYCVLRIQEQLFMHSRQDKAELSSVSAKLRPLGTWNR